MIPQQISEDKLQQVWKEYKSTNGVKLRNQLTEHYLALVKYAAVRLKSKLPDHVDINELISVGTFGLMDAITKFDLNRDVKFETYCALRIRGQMIDALREMDWVPRNVRRKSHKLEEAYQYLEHELGRPPTEEELAENMGMSLEEMVALVRDINMGEIVSIDALTTTTESGQKRRIELIDARRKNDPYWHASRDELKALIVNGLSEKEKLIIVMYYYDEMTMKEIGAVLGVNESRICQIHSKLMTRMRTKLTQWQDEV